MAVFAIISNVPNQALAKLAADVYPDMSLPISDSVWLVADGAKTTKEVSEKLNIKEGGFSGVIVLRVDSYFGFAAPTIWEWIKVKGDGA